MKVESPTDYLNTLKLRLTGLADEEVTSAQPKKDGSVTVGPGSLRRRARGLDWPVNGLTMVGVRRLNNVQECIERALADGVPGDLVETGVWRGGTAMFMRAVLKAHDVTDRVVYAADSFEGLPRADDERFPADAARHFEKFDFLSVSLETVQANFREYGLFDDQVRFVKGWFRDTMPTLAGHTWSLIRMDGDMYESTIVVLEHLYPGLSPGGFLIVDDYNGIEACRKAVDDYRRDHGIREEIQRIDWTGVYWRKDGGADD
jgi:O-methyltransferase